MTELKRCPFCGGEARSYRGKHDDHGVCCTKCSAKVCGYMTKGGATKAWNRRATKTPCDLCRFNPPSSMDGKPCTMCVAEGRLTDDN